MKNNTYRMPAEWEPHEATWLAWPHEKSDWPGKFAPIPWIYGEIVRHLARVEKVRILVEDRNAEQAISKILTKCHADMAAVEFYIHQTDRSWTRDSCPPFVRSRAGEVAISHWKFNAWAKYPNYLNDAATPAFLAQSLGLARVLDWLAAQPRVWITRRIDIARHWKQVHPAPR